MQLAIVADADLKERVRCVRSIAAQTSVSALGVATWAELEQALIDVPLVSLIIYAPPLPGAPDDVVAQLLMRATRLVIASADDAASLPGDDADPTRIARPISEEMLALLARGAGGQSATHRMSFAPVDFLQMLCMSGDSHILVMSRADADVGIIEVHEGRVWTAFDALGIGEEAFARLVRPELRARVSPAVGSRKERTIFRDLSELLLDSLRRIDEGSVHAPPPLSTRRVQAALASPDELAARIKELNGTARKLLMDRNYDEAARVLIHISELDPASPIVRANLEQLRKLGYPR